MLPDRITDASASAGTSNLPEYDCGGKSQVVEQGLPVDPGLHEHCGALQQRPMARLADQVEDLLVLRAHARPNACKRRHIELRPMAETPLPEHSKAAHAGSQAHVRADEVSRMLAVSHRRVGIVVHAAATGGSHLVEPPVV